ncbi:MAG: aldehyde dehydrogenase family protein, partial [Ignavibacteria bacterium]|nr:aldehyde dehydrogenase family protein [Ignavibacteria bacterium]
MPIVTMNPATGKIIKEFTSHTSAEVESFINQSHNAFLNWRTTNFPERRNLMNRASEILIKDKQKYGSILTLEMGKTISQAVAEVEKCAWVCKYYA